MCDVHGSDYLSLVPRCFSSLFLFQASDLTSYFQVTSPMDKHFQEVAHLNCRLQDPDAFTDDHMLLDVIWKLFSESQRLFRRKVQGFLFLEKLSFLLEL